MQAVGDGPSHDDHLRAVKETVHRQSLGLDRNSEIDAGQASLSASAIKVTGQTEKTHRIEGHQECGVDFFVGLVGRVQEDALVCVFRGGQERVEVQAEAAVSRRGFGCGVVDAGVRGARQVEGQVKDAERISIGTGRRLV